MKESVEHTFTSVRLQIARRYEEEDKVGWCGDVVQHHARSHAMVIGTVLHSAQLCRPNYGLLFLKLIPLLCLLPTSILLAVSKSELQLRRCPQHLVHCENQWHWTRVEDIWTWYFSFSFSFSFSLSFASPSPSPPPLLSSLPFPYWTITDYLY